MSDAELRMQWTLGNELASLFINFADLSFDLHFDGAQGRQTLSF